VPEEGNKQKAIQEMISAEGCLALLLSINCPLLGYQEYIKKPKYFIGFIFVINVQSVSDVRVMLMLKSICLASAFRKKTRGCESVVRKNAPQLR